MGRFSKLETETGGTSEREPEDGAFGLRSRVRRKDAAQDESESDYDQGHYLAEADRMFYAGEYQKSMRLYSRAMQVDNSAVEPWVGQILALVRLKQNREAAMWAMRAMELFPEEPRLASLQGLTLALTGSTQRAISCSDFAMARPDGAGAFMWAVRGQILSHNENPNAAFCFQKAMDTREPGDWKILAHVGNFLLAEKKWAKSLEFLKPAVQTNPSNAWLWKQVGIANEHLGFTQPAMEAYKAALEINHNDRKAQEHIRRLTSVSLPVRLWRRLTG